MSLFLIDIVLYPLERRVYSRP